MTTRLSKKDSIGRIIKPMNHKYESTHVSVKVLLKV